MKIYYFIVVTIGLMFLFNLAGITNESKSIDYTGLGNGSVPPDFTPSSEETDASNLSHSTTFWALIAAAAALFFAGSFRVSAGIVQFQLVTETIFAGIASFIAVMFLSDVYSILSKMYEITGGTGIWYYLTWMIIAPYLVGFGAALVEFIRGSD
jgi:hypothetical protein